MNPCGETGLAGAKDTPHGVGLNPRHPLAVDVVNLGHRLPTERENGGCDSLIPPLPLSESTISTEIYTDVSERSSRGGGGWSGND